MGTHATDTALGARGGEDRICIMVRRQFYAEGNAFAAIPTTSSQRFPDAGHLTIRGAEQLQEI